MRKLYLFFAFVFFSVAYGQAPFITTWQILSVDSNKTIEIMVWPGENVNYTIDFGDGVVLTNQTDSVSHTYNDFGTYTVTMSGNFNKISFYSYYNTIKLKSVEQWGDTHWTSMADMFNTCTHVTINATDVPDLSQVTDCARMFIHCNALNQSIDNWDVSNVTNMANMFCSSGYNQPLNSWDVSNVTDMSGMFSLSTFNKPLNNWDVSNVTSMLGMFSEASSFNQPLNDWDVSNVISMDKMFNYADSFNQPLDNWDVSNVTDMAEMFYGATSFNQPLNNWNVSNVQYMIRMFAHASVFNQPLNSWDVSAVEDMTNMFSNALIFNQDLSSWDFSSVGDFEKFINYSGLDVDNYDALLLAFAQSGIEDGSLSGYGLHYCDSGVRNYLIDSLDWYIYSDALGDGCEGNTISGSVHFDQDGSGCDTGLPAQLFLVSAYDGNFDYLSSTDIAGHYETLVMDNTYTTTLLNVPDYYTVSPQQQTIAFTGFGGEEEEVNFCLTANQSVQDLNITLLPIGGAPRPGFSSQYQLIAQNIGTQTVANASVSLAYDNAIQSFTSAVPAATSATAGQLAFDLTNLQPFESRVINITMNTLAPPTVNGGEVAHFTATVTPDSGDFTLADNTFALAQTVVNSFDPNDKQVLQGDEISLEQAGGYLDYIIRFQNTGTASAITVRIKDNLPENVDWTTLRPVSSSHPYILKLKDDNTVEFIFNNINLPNESADEPGSHGFIAYKIKPVSTVAVGDIITGNAEIFFDYNLPIVTNFATTEVMETMGLGESIANHIAIYPNPVSNVLNLNAANGITIKEVKVFNLQGRELLSSKATESLNVENLSTGVYILMVKTGAGIEKHKLVKK
ncbi:hypothetical protein HYN59_10405 [Flavobacterium album]|uniref:PKD domain-containing protein n=1 Tax=Flavobacterium album TaxID=2175091 RepID=A0A2S1QYP7_9FLAO|nr:BspA family leucine-rich repeat surface protein [Flavobacterium album]AWH85502.1 hypothetical protein HYN59_10405 [Flavobacterium album]